MKARRAALCQRGWRSRRVCDSNDGWHRCKRDAGHKGPCRCEVCNAAYINGFAVEDSSPDDERGQSSRPPGDSSGA